MNDPGRRVALRDALASKSSKWANAFEQRLLLECMPSWKRPIAAVLLRVWPKALKPDLEVMRDAGDAWNLDQVRAQVVELKRPRSGWSLVRDGLSIRASGRRLVQMAAWEFGPTRRGPAAGQAGADSGTSSLMTPQPDAELGVQAMKAHSNGTSAAARPE
jgi:hypothetical protein